MDMGERKASRAQVTPLAAFCTMFAVACAGAPGLKDTFSGGDDLRGRAAQPLLEQIERRERPVSVAAAVGVTGHGLVGRVLPDGPIWDHRGPVDTLPVLDGQFVAFSGGGQVTLLAVATGNPLWSIPSGGRQLSALAHDGRRALLVLSDPHDSRAQLVLIVDEVGRTLHTARSEAAVGRPAALQGLALVPWGGRYVSVIDLLRGTSLGHLDVASATTAVVADPSGVLSYNQGVVSLADDVVSQPRPLPVTLPVKNLPGAPRWPTDATRTLEPRGIPVAIYTHPTLRGGKIGFSGDAFASTYYRVVLGFDVRDGELRWATYFLRDVLGGASSTEGVTLCLEDGSLWRLSWQDGSRGSSGSLGSRLRACVVSPDPRPVEGVRAVPLAEQVATTLTDTGPEMAPVHQILLDELSEQPSAEVTRLLVEIARSPRASADLAEQAAQRLAMRRTGAEHLITALRESMDFDVTKRPAPLAAIASALFAMDAREGATPLAQHLVDPRTTMADQLMLARVLRVLAGPEQVPELSEYFSLYRTAAGEPELAQAVLLTAQTLWTLGGEEARALVVEAARDPMTHPNVRGELEKLISGGDGRGEHSSPAPDNDASRVVHPPNE